MSKETCCISDKLMSLWISKASSKFYKDPEATLDFETIFRIGFNYGDYYRFEVQAGRDPNPKGKKEKEQSMTETDRKEVAEILSYEFQDQQDLEDVVLGLNEAFGEHWVVGSRNNEGYLKVSYVD